MHDWSKKIVTNSTAWRGKNALLLLLLLLEFVRGISIVYFNSWELVSAHSTWKSEADSYPKIYIMNN